MKSTAPEVAMPVGRTTASVKDSASGIRATTLSSAMVSTRVIPVSAIAGQEEGEGQRGEGRGEAHRSAMHHGRA